MNLERLRSDTRAEHEAAEGAMPLMQPGVSLEQYAGILRRLQPVVTGWEQWAETHAPEDLVKMVKARQRGVLIKQDLQSLGMNGVLEEPGFRAERVPGLESAANTFRASFLGAMYVMEGSTLGGQRIARHVEEVLGVKAGEGDAFFRGHGERTGEMWRAFKAVVAEVPDRDSDDVIAAAKAMFDVFRAALVA